MSERAGDLQYLLDRAAIHDTIVRYFQGIDRSDAHQVRSCFTHDVTTRYDGRAPTSGIEALMTSFSTFPRYAAGTLKTTTHFMGNFHIAAIEGNSARTETNAIAFLVGPADDGDTVAVRSLRYLDRWRRESDGWRICDRTHTLDWSAEVPANFATTLAKRMSAWGASGDE